MRVQHGRAAAHNLRFFCVRSDHRNLSDIGREGQGCVVVFQQNCRFGARATDQGAVFRAIIGGFDKIAMIPQRPNTLHQAYHIDGAGAQCIARHLARSHGGDQFFAAIPCGTRHFKIKPRIHRGRGCA